MKASHWRTSSLVEMRVFNSGQNASVERYEILKINYLDPSLSYLLQLGRIEASTNLKRTDQVQTA